MDKKILFNHYLSVDSYNSYVAAYILRLAALGYTSPSVTVLNAMNVFFNSLGITLTAKLDVLYLIALNNAALQNAASLNLISPSLYQMTFTLSPTYGVKGIRPNGTTSYANTNFNPATNGVQYTINAASIILYLETAPTIGTSITGTLTTSTRNNIVYSSTTGHRINSSSNLSSAVDMTGLGYKAMDRSAGNVALYNELTKSDRTQAANDLVSNAQTLGKNGALFSDSEIGFFAMGGTLSQAEHTTIRAAVLAFRTAIGL